MGKVVTRAGDDTSFGWTDERLAIASSAPRNLPFRTMNSSASARALHDVPVRQPRQTPLAPALVVNTPDGPTVRPVPLLLAEGAKKALHAHAVRDAARAAVLLSADVAVLLGARVLLRALFEVPAVALTATAVTSRVPLESSSSWLAHLHWLLAASDAKAIVAMVLGLAFAGAYRPGDHRRSASVLILGVCVGVLLNGWENLWHVPDAIPVVAAGALAMGLSLYAARVSLDRVVQATRRAWDTPRRALVVGQPWATQEAMQSSAFPKSRAFTVLGGIDASAERGKVAAEGMLGTLADMPRLLVEEGVETVILAGALPHDTYRNVVHMADAAGCAVFALPTAESLRGFDPELEWYGGEALIRLSHPGSLAWQMAAKRALDIIGSGMGLLVLAPLFAAIALAIRVSSPGPVMFTQLRFGRGGRMFKIYKFRTMVVDAEERKKELAAQNSYDSAHMFKIARDPRITRIGAFLRKTSLDELPQLLNVFKGDMSLVGPRPLPSEGVEYDEHHTARLAVRPGITGPWQVSGRNQITDFEQVVALEVEYLRAWSFWRDVEILARTVPAVLIGRGAY
jgi:exopolysaccharide biosynthesis polyprenyl glycosylphosphotransferase